MSIFNIYLGKTLYVAIMLALPNMVLAETKAKVTDSSDTLDEVIVVSKSESPEIPSEKTKSYTIKNLPRRLG